MSGQFLLHSHHPLIECFSDVLLKALGQLQVVDTHFLTNTLLIQIEGCLQALKREGNTHTQSITSLKLYTITLSVSNTIVKLSTYYQQY